MDESPHVGHSVASLSHKDLGCFPSVGLQLADVGTFQFAENLAVLCRAQYGHRRVGHGGVGVDEVSHVACIDRFVCAFLRCEAHESLAVEFDFVIVNEVGVFVFVHAVGREIDHSFFFVNPLYLTYIPFAFGHLVDDLSLSPVVEVEVGVVVALAHPEDAFAVLEVVAEVSVVVHVLLAGLLDDGSYLARDGRHLEESVVVVSAFVELEGDTLVVLVPLWCIDMVLAVEELCRWDEHLGCSHLHDDGHSVVERVARLGVFQCPELRLQLVAWR